MRTLLWAGLLGLAPFVGGMAHADAVEALRDFAREARSGRAEFVQTVTAPDGKRRKTAAGSFEFQRPNQFRFAYTRPAEQLIVADGQKVWLYDPDLNQASSRRMSEALSATPAALLAGANLSKDFDLRALPAAQGLDWVQVQPKRPDGQIQSMRVAFKGRELAAIEVVDGFGQRSLMEFKGLSLNLPLSADRFRFVPPAGADVTEQ